MSRKGKPRSRSKKQSNSSVSTVRSLFLFVQYCFKEELGNKAASAQTKPFGLASDRLGLTPRTPEHQHYPMKPNAAKLRHGSAESTPTPKQGVRPSQTLDHRNCEARQDTPSEIDPKPTMCNTQTCWMKPTDEDNLRQRRRHSERLLRPPGTTQLPATASRGPIEANPQAGDTKSYFRIRKRKPTQIRPH